MRPPGPSHSEPNLTVYRAFRLNTLGRVQDVPHLIEAFDDRDAIRQAELLEHRDGIELWESARLVARITNGQCRLPKS